MQDGWWRCTWRTWTLLALLLIVAADCAALWYGAVDWWLAALPVLGVLALARMAVAAASKDDRQRRQGATNAIQQLDASAQAALQLAGQLRQLRMWRFWKLIFDLFAEMNSTVSQADRMHAA